MNGADKVAIKLKVELAPILGETVIIRNYVHQNHFVTISFGSNLISMLVTKPESDSSASKHCEHENILNAIKMQVSLSSHF